MDIAVVRALQGVWDIEGELARRGQQEQLGQQEQPGLLDQVDPLEILVILVLVELEQRVQQVQQVQQVQRVQRDVQGLSARKVLLEIQYITANKDLLAGLVTQVTQGTQVIQVSLAQPGAQALLVPLVRPD